MGKFHHSHHHDGGGNHGCGHQCQKGCGQSCGKCRCYSKLKPIALALAGGVVGGIGTLFLGWSAAVGNLGVAMVRVLSSVYLGFEPTMHGAFTGGAWGFADGFVSGLIFGYAYNLFLCCYFHSKSCCSKRLCHSDSDSHQHPEQGGQGDMH